jgi:signal transduction histidine kinase
MGQRYLQPVGGSVARGALGSLRRRRVPASIRLFARGKWASRFVAGLSTPDVRVLVLAGLALAAAGGEQMRESIVDDGRLDVALMLRTAVVVALALGGIAIQLSSNRQRIGRLLLAAAVIPGISLLNASHEFIEFSIGVLALSLTPALFSFLMLALPAGRIDSPLERKFVGASACAALLLGIAVSLAPRQAVPSWLMQGAAVVTAVGTALLMVRRAYRVNPRVRGLLAPMVTLAVLYGAVAIAYVIVRALGPLATARDGLQIANVATALAIPVAILLGLAVERMSLGRVLASFVSSLGKEPASNVQAAMAATLNDPMLRIYYRRDGTGEFVDATGRCRLPAPTASRRQTVIGGRGRPAAVVDYDANLSGQEEFLRAAAATALLRIEQERLVADLAAASANLEASQLRLSQTADEERQKIQRDLHDGAQQHLIGMHVKLELALQSLAAEPARSAGLLVEVEEQMDETARDLRSLATKVFPPTLKEYGLVDALASAIRTMGLAVHLEARSIGRHPPEVEMQLYFVCLEGLQNIGKHCGPGVAATLRIWAVRSRLFFELRDMGPGFDQSAVTDGLGLGNMADRLSSIGGRLTVVGRPGHGTVVKGVVPARMAPGPLP